MQLQSCFFELNFGTDEFILQFHYDPIFNFFPLRWHIVAFLAHFPQQSLQPDQLSLTLSYQYSISLSFLDHFAKVEVFFVKGIQLGLDAAELSCIKLHLLLSRQFSLWRSTVRTGGSLSGDRCIEIIIIDEYPASRRTHTHDIPIPQPHHQARKKTRRILQKLSHLLRPCRTVHAVGVQNRPTHQRQRVNLKTEIFHDRRTRPFRDGAKRLGHCSSPLSKFLLQMIVYTASTFKYENYSTCPNEQLKIFTQFTNFALMRMSQTSSDKAIYRAEVVVYNFHFRIIEEHRSYSCVKSINNLFVSSERTQKAL